MIYVTSFQEVKGHVSLGSRCKLDLSLVSEVCQTVEDESIFYSRIQNRGQVWRPRFLITVINANDRINRSNTGQT
jgi:hypothetical protein